MPLQKFIVGQIVKVAPNPSLITELNGYVGRVRKVANASVVVHRASNGIEHIVANANVSLP